jgi:hypothetical protein
MKKLAAILALSALGILLSLGVTRSLGEIPQSAHSAADIVKMVEARIIQTGDNEEKENKLRLISVEWCREDRFRTPQWLGGDSWREKNPQWAWFVTYAVRETTTKAFQIVLIYRVLENGQNRCNHASPHLSS